MIPGTGWVATFQYDGTKADGSPYRTFERLPVIYFDDDGSGYVASVGRRSSAYRRPVEASANFVRYEQESIPVAVIPAPGWTRHTEHGDVYPVVGWVTMSNGDVRAIELDGDGPELAPRLEGTYEPPGGWDNWQLCPSQQL